jgi:hypothetical protein
MAAPSAIERRLPPYMRLQPRLRDPLELALLAELRFKLGEHLHHVEECLAAAVVVSIGCSVAFRLAPSPGEFA